MTAETDRIGAESAILACVDGSIYSSSVADHAAWAATRLGAPVELLQVIGRRDASSQDRSGRIIAGARRQLLEELATLDAERAKLMIRQARLDLDDARARLLEAGVGSVGASVRNGDLLEEIAEREKSAGLTVIGKRGEAADFAKLHLGSNLERIVRAARNPVLIASRAFRPIQRFLIAFDGRPSALRAVDEASRSPLFAGLEAVIVTAGEGRQSEKDQAKAAADQLRAGGFAVRAEIMPGPANVVIPETVAREKIDLVLMGTYGQSRLRSLVIGSTTSEMIRDSLTPVMVFP